MIKVQTRYSLIIPSVILFLLFSSCKSQDDTQVVDDDQCKNGCPEGKYCLNGRCVGVGGDSEDAEIAADDAGEDDSASSGGNSDASKQDSGESPDSSGNEGEGEDTGVKQCPALCRLPNTEESECNAEEGFCVVLKCKTGYYDINRDPKDGCEYKCALTNAGVDICDGVDNDCDGTVDNGSLLKTDPTNCSACNKPCPGLNKPHTVALCQEAACSITCTDGYYDNNEDPNDGCESNKCEPTGEEKCDAIDNDCDGQIDEDFDKNLDTSCGPGCVNCTTLFGPYSLAKCYEGECLFAGCESGHANLNGDLSDGCESGCIPADPPIEICDTVDNDCDPATPDGKDDTMNGQSCQALYAEGVCKEGTFKCEWGTIKCLSNKNPVDEICDGLDNDCDGEVDESVVDCKSNEQCINGKCAKVCNPNCTGKECGDDLCGGSCGTCSKDKVCNSSGLCIANCAPVCQGKQCGPDECGGSCGSCNANEYCKADGTCSANCTPNCTGKECGADGCGGSCGTCPSDKNCSASGVCVITCVPECTNKECGADGCGNTCNTCPDGKVCENFKCITPRPPIGTDSIRIEMVHEFDSGNTCYVFSCSDQRNVNMYLTGPKYTCPPDQTSPENRCYFYSRANSEKTTVEFYVPTTAYDGNWDITMQYVQDCYKLDNISGVCYETRGDNGKATLYINGTPSGERYFRLEQQNDSRFVMRVIRENGFFRLSATP